MTLDESRDTDNVYDIEGIKVLFDKDTSRYTRGFEIDFRHSIFGKRFSINQLNGSGSC